MELLITGAWAQARAHIPSIAAMGHRVRFLAQEAEALPDGPPVEGLVCNGLFLHHSLEEFPALRWVQLTSAGFDRVPLEALRARGVRLCNARGVYSAPMAELAMAGVLGLYKQTDFFRANQRAHRWEKHRGLLELEGKAVTILGCGSVGGACAARFRAFGCRVTGVDLLPRSDPAYDRMVPLEGLDRLLPETDILILTLPLSPETRGLLHGARLRALKAGALLVNIARGPIVEEAALIQALGAGHLGGAVLDVFETEPLAPDSPLWDLDRVILTPHNSFVGDRVQDRLSRLILDNLGRETGAPAP